MSGRIEPLGESAFRLVWDDDPELPASAETAFDRALTIAVRLAAERPVGVLDAVPGAGCVVVSFDPLVVAPEAVAAWLGFAIVSAVQLHDDRQPRTVTIPVLYDAADPDVSPDLAALAADKAMSVDELVARHAAATYRCVMLGFRPGFPYLDGLDPALAAARLPTPRTRVPAGAVGIGGAQTGVYPVASPGGWRIIGRTSALLFDPARKEPFLVHAGDLVRFEPVDRLRFDRGQ